MIAITIQNYSKNSFKFNKIKEDRDIYESYENAYDQLSEDDLKSTIYAEEYQFDLAFETHNTLGSSSRSLMLLNWESGVGFYRKVFSETPKSLHVLDIAEEYIKNASRIFSDLTMVLQIFNFCG